jgi:hypothetical protein
VLVVTCENCLAACICGEVTVPRQHRHWELLRLRFSNTLLILLSGFDSGSEVLFQETTCPKSVRYQVLSDRPNPCWSLKARRTSQCAEYDVPQAFVSVRHHLQYLTARNNHLLYLRVLLPLGSSRVSLLSLSRCYWCKCSGFSPHTPHSCAS